MHPTSAVCGLPYEESLEFILKTEKLQRGYYSGYIGPIYKDGNFDFFVNLRCAMAFQNSLVLYAGAGINSMSDPEAEWDEVKRKKQVIASKLGSSSEFGA